MVGGGGEGCSVVIDLEYLAKVYFRKLSYMKVSIQIWFEVAQQPHRVS